MASEKRRNPRLEVELQGSCNGAPCEIQNVSLDGLKLKTGEKLEAGAFADLTFDLPDKASYLFSNPENRSIHINVHVKWCQPLPDGKFDIGAEIFMMLDGTEEPFFAYVLGGLEGRGMGAGP